MSTPKHTAGPWTYSEDMGLIGTAEGTIAQLQNSVGWAGIGRNIDHSEQQANAQLIAAAPELLEVLGEIHALIDPNRDVKDIEVEEISMALINRVQTAITKAGG